MPSSHQPDIHQLVTDLPGSENKPGQREPQAHRVSPRTDQKKGWIAAALAFLLVFSGLSVAAIIIGNSQKASLDEELSSLRQSQKDTQEKLALAQAEERRSQRQSLLDRLERLRLGFHSTTWNAAKSWSDQAWELAGQAAAISIDDPLRNQAAATLLGLDARVVKRFREMAASSVLFDNADERLLIGGGPAHQKNPAEGAKVWDCHTNVILHVSKHQDAGPVAFGPERSPLQLVVQEGPSLLLWDVAKQAPVMEYHFNPDQDRVAQWALNGHGDPLVGMTGDGSFVAAAGITAMEKRVIAVWEGLSGKRLFQISTQVTALAFSPHGEYLATGDDQGKTTLWPVHEEELRYIHAGRLAIHSLAFSPDSGRLAIGNAGGGIMIWKLGPGLPPVSCSGPADDILALAFSHDGTLLASGGRSSTRLWDAATGRLLLEIGCENAIMGLAFSHDGRRLAISSRCRLSQGGVAVWELDYGRGVQALRGLAAPASRVCFSPDGRFFAALALDGQTAIWNMETSRLVRILDFPQGEIAGLAFSPDSKRLVHSAANKATSWELATGKQLGAWELPHGSRDTVFFHGADGKLLLFRMEVKDQRPICLVRSLIEPNMVGSVAEIKELDREITDAKAPLDGSYLVVEAKLNAKDDNAVKERQGIEAFDPHTGQKIWPPADIESVEGNHLCVDPTGKVFAFQAADQKIKLVEMPGGKVSDFPDRELTALGAAGQLWIEPHREQTQPFGYSLFRSGHRTPVVTLGIDNPATANAAQFNLAGTMLAWTNPDGTVTLSDLESLRKKLAEIGLGW